MALSKKATAKKPRRMRDLAASKKTAAAGVKGGQVKKWIE
jgi:hypothetical protein